MGEVYLCVGRRTRDVIFDTLPNEGLYN